MSDQTDHFRALADNLVTRLASRESRAHAEAMIAEELAAAYAAGQAEALAWRPIETAPRDGTVIDVWTMDPIFETIPHRVTDVHWHGGWVRNMDLGALEIDHAVAWSPIATPPPPAAEPAREDGA